MPEFTLWTPEEMLEREKPRRERAREAKERMISEYSAYLKAAKPGFGGQIVLGDEEDKRKVRAIVREAAQRNGLTLRFRPIKDKGRIEFSVTDANSGNKSRGATKPGRPRKSDA
jgi:hypothetical protein